MGTWDGNGMAWHGMVMAWTFCRGGRRWGDSVKRQIRTLDLVGTFPPHPLVEDISDLSLLRCRQRQRVPRRHRQALCLVAALGGHGGHSAAQNPGFCTRESGISASGSRLASQLWVSLLITEGYAGKSVVLSRGCSGAMLVDFRAGTVLAPLELHGAPTPQRDSISHTFIPMSKAPLTERPFTHDTIPGY